MDERTIREKYANLKSVLNERSRRIWAATEARAIGRGGNAIVCRATGLNPRTVARGIKELSSPEQLDPGRIRRPGAGRKRAVDKDPTLLSDLNSLVEPSTRGDPESPLRWTTKSLRKLADQLQKMGHQASYFWVKTQLRKMGYSLQANRKTKEGTNHPDRDAQFKHINHKVKEQQETGDPVISVDAKKKENVGNFKNNGREWRPKGNPEEVRMHDFMDKEQGKAIPYGAFDLTKNKGWVNVGISHETSEFAVESIRSWWYEMGREDYPHAKSILITADCGGSNGVRRRLWKWELQKLANELGLPITVAHFPPGTSKWNPIEHKLFSFISQNWRGRPLLTHAIIVNLIGLTTTAKGLKVRCRLDQKKYPKGIKVTDQQMATINIKRDEFHGDWNYTIHPNNTQNR